MVLFLFTSYKQIYLLRVNKNERFKIRQGKYIPINKIFSNVIKFSVYTIKYLSKLLSTVVNCQSDNLRFSNVF